MLLIQPRDPCRKDMLATSSTCPGPIQFGTGLPGTRLPPEANPFISPLASTAIPIFPPVPRTGSHTMRVGRVQKYHQIDEASPKPAPFMPPQYSRSVALLIKGPWELLQLREGNAPLHRRMGSTRLRAERRPFRPTKAVVVFTICWSSVGPLDVVTSGYTALLGVLG